MNTETKPQHDAGRDAPSPETTGTGETMEALREKAMRRVIDAAIDLQATGDLTGDEDHDVYLAKRALANALSDLRYVPAAAPSPPPGTRTDAERLDFLGNCPPSALTAVFGLIDDGEDPRIVIDNAIRAYRDTAALSAERAP